LLRCRGGTAPSISQSAIAAISDRPILFTFAFREATATGYARSPTASTATGHANRSAFTDLDDGTTYQST
jgi:hypothetical protein